MGSIYKALTRANNLQDLSSAFGTYVRNKAHEKGLKDLHELNQSTNDTFSSVVNGDTDRLAIQSPQLQQSSPLDLLTGQPQTGTANNAGGNSNIPGQNGTGETTATPTPLKALTAVPPLPLAQAIASAIGRVPAGASRVQTASTTGTPLQQLTAQAPSTTGQATAVNLTETPATGNNNAVSPLTLLTTAQKMQIASSERARRNGAVEKALAERIDAINAIKGITQQEKNEAIASATRKASAYMTGAEPEGFTLSSGDKRYNAYGDVLADNPKPVETKPYDIEGDYENPKTGTHWSFDKGKGKFIDTTIPYDKDKSRAHISINTGKYPDYGKSLGNVNGYISRILALKGARWDKTQNKYKVPTGKIDDNGAPRYEYLTQKELGIKKESIKDEAKPVAIEMVHSQGLDDAVLSVRSAITGNNSQGKKYSLNEALNILKQSNPQLTNDNLRVLNDYFELLLQ